MKTLLFFIAAFTGLSLISACGSETGNAVTTDTVYVNVTPPDPLLDTTNLGPNEFLMQEGDTFYIMKQYFMAFLNAVPNRPELDSATTMEIQMAHLGHLDSLARIGKIDVVGPFGDDTESRGIAIYNVATLEEAEELANQDPAVKAGRLLIEVRPWWSAKGTRLR